MKEAIRVHTSRAEEAIVEEMNQYFEDKEVLVPIMTVNSCGRRHTKILPSSMFCREKHSARTNEFEKLKAWLVGGGHTTDRSLYTNHNVSSPIVKTESLMAVLSISAFEKRVITTINYQEYTSMPHWTTHAQFGFPEMSRMCMCDINRR